MKRYSLIIAMLALTALLHAQSIELAPSVIASAGDYYEGSTISLSWTLGEVAVATLPGTNFTLTQGFQQGDLGGVGFTLREIDWSIEAFPNPATNVVNIIFTVQETSDYMIEIQDVAGKILSQENYESISSGTKQVVDVSPLKPGAYFFKIYSSDRTQLRVLRITKL